MRRYGLYKIDTKLVHARTNAPKGPSRDKVGAKMIAFRGKVKNLKSKVQYEKDLVKKSEFEIELAAAEQSLAALSKQFRELDAVKGIKKVTQVHIPKKMGKPESKLKFYDTGNYQNTILEAEDDADN